MADGSIRDSFSIREIAAALKRDASSAAKRARNERWAFSESSVRGGRRRLYPLASLPADVQAALLLRHAPAAPRRPAPTEAHWTFDQIEAAYERFDRAPAAQRAIAQQRHRALLAVETLVAQGLPIMQAREQVAAQLKRENVRGASTVSLWRWREELGDAPRAYWLGLLLPRHAGRTGTAECSEEAWDFFKGDYLRLEKPSAESVYERLQRAARKNGWAVPCLRTLMRRLERELPPPVIVLARDGEEALLRTFPSQERDHSVFHACEAVNADGHRFDVFVRFGDGTVARPILVGWQDILSGKVLAYRVGATESSDLVRLSFADLVRVYGVPRHAWLDNGRSFAAKMLTGGARTRYRFKVREEDPTGIFVALGMEVHWATPYHGQSKPIERAWRDLCDRVAKHPAFAGAYTGNSPTAKPENYGASAVPIDEFLRVLAEEIAAHNAREGRESKVCAGRSFDAVFAESYARSAIRKATTSQLRSLLLAAEAVRANAQDGSVHLGGNRYWTEELARLAGQKVVLRFDPDNLHSSVAVHTMDGAFIADAPCVMSVGFADTAAGREHARARKQYAKAHKSKLDAERRMNAAQVAAQIPAPPPGALPEAAVIAPVFNAARSRRTSPENKQVLPVARTGTDDIPPHEVAIDRYFIELQQRQIKDLGWTPPEDSP